MKRVHLIISGDVVGVGFRAFVRERATRLGLTGWVKNRQDRTVEVVAEGPQAKLEELVSACRRGPTVAWVEKVDTAWEKATGEWASFDISSAEA